jgi:hypothetical protein
MWNELFSLRKQRSHAVPSRVYAGGTSIWSEDAAALNLRHAQSTVLSQTTQSESYVLDSDVVSSRIEATVIFSGQLASLPNFMSA